MGGGERLVRTSAIVIGLALAAPWAFAGSSGSAPALYTKAQAQQGAKAYSGNCAGCHGSKLQGSIGPALAGQPFQQLAAARNFTAKSLLHVTSTTMPQSDPGSLKTSQYDAIVAFLLQKNGYPAGSTKLTASESGLSSLKLGK